MALSGGPISILASGKIKFGTNVDVTLSNGTAEDVYWETADTVDIGGGSEWKGTLYSTKSDSPNQESITTGTNVNIIGSTGYRHGTRFLFDSGYRLWTG